MPTVLVGGDIVKPGVVLTNIKPDSFIVELADQIVSKRPDLNKSFVFCKNKECTDECELIDLVSSLGKAKNAYVVFVRTVPAAGAYLH